MSVEDWYAPGTSREHRWSRQWNVTSRDGIWYAGAWLMGMVELEMVGVRAHKWVRIRV